MTKLHEIIAIEPDLAGTAHKVMEEAMNTFSKKADLFLGETSVIEYFDDSKSYLNTTERKNITESVPSKLDYVKDHVARYYDAFYAKEASNQNAKADIILPDGQVLVADVPATVLLGLESRLKELRGVLSSIPTLQPGVKWQPDPTAELPGVYVTTFPELRYITQRTIQPVELAPATKEHKAQVEKVEVDEKVAKKERTVMAGMYSPHEKSERLGRLDTLLQAVKQARQRANNVEAEKANGFGSRLMEYLMS
jgi:hypothetical protein